MSQEYRIVIQRGQTTDEYDDGETLHLGEYQHPTTLLQLGLRHTEQLEILHNLKAVRKGDRRTKTREYRFFKKQNRQLNTIF